MCRAKANLVQNVIIFFRFYSVPHSGSEEGNMFRWAVIFLVIALIAALFGFSGIAGTATNIAWILFVVGLIVAIVFFIMGRRPTG